MPVAGAGFGGSAWEIERMGVGRRVTAGLPYAQDTETIVARIPPEEICYVNALMESYEGIGIMRTRDPQVGIIEFWVIREFREQFEAVLEDLRQELDLQVLTIPPASRL